MPYVSYISLIFHYYFAIHHKICVANRIINIIIFYSSTLLTRRNIVAKQSFVQSTTEKKFIAQILPYYFSITSQWYIFINMVKLKTKQTNKRRLTVNRITVIGFIFNVFLSEEIVLLLIIFHFILSKFLEKQMKK